MEGGRVRTFSVATFASDFTFSLRRERMGFGGLEVCKARSELLRIKLMKQQQEHISKPSNCFI